MTNLKAHSLPKVSFKRSPPSVGSLMRQEVAATCQVRKQLPRTCWTLAVSQLPICQLAPGGLQEHCISWGALCCLQALGTQAQGVFHFAG